MSAVILIVIVGLWFAFGLLVWRTFIRKRIATPMVRGVALIGFLAIWMVGPWLDEILGAREFERFCADLGPTGFYGPVSVGPGVFVDEEGRPKWQGRDDFMLKFWAKPAWKAIFEKREEHVSISRWPMPIVESRALTTERATGRLVWEWRGRYSPGGWIKRLLNAA
jgi:hypothetical protein